MTYCLGLLVDDGLLLMADTRTNGGIDNISSYRKLHALSDEPGRELYVAMCGSLSASQRALARLIEPGAGRAQSLGEARSMTEAADLVGEAVRSANKELLEALGPDKAKSGCSLLLGGRIGGGRPRLFLVYAEGNHIECQREIPFLQIGETKYGRPILDRILRPSTSLPAAIKVALLSFDSAMRSNLSIALPIDMIAIPAAPGLPTVARRIGQNDAYFADLSQRWSATLAEAAGVMPDPAFVPELEPVRALSLVAEARA